MPKIKSTKIKNNKNDNEESRINKIINNDKNKSSEHQIISPNSQLANSSARSNTSSNPRTSDNNSPSRLSKIFNILTIVIWNIFIIIILFIILEFLSTIFVNTYYSSDKAINYEVFPNKTFGEEYFKQVNSIKTVYSPYIEYTREPNISLPYVNIDENSLRKTANPCASVNSINIFVFGGSTLWGTGARDAYTIPSEISKKLCNLGYSVKVTNFGESGYENTKELIRLELELRKGNIPDLVIFYDGVNEVYSAFQNGFAGFPQNLDNRKAEFNTKGRLNIMNYVRYSNFMTIIRGISKRIFKNQKSTNNNSNPQEKLNSLSTEIVSIYFNNTEIIQSLGKQYNFTAYYFWQPIIYFNKPLTSGEKSVTLENVKPLYFATYPKIPNQDPNINFYDISDTLKDTQEPVYLDFAHLNEKGHKIVAERIVEIISKDRIFKS